MGMLINYLEDARIIPTISDINLDLFQASWVCASNSYESKAHWHKCASNFQLFGAHLKIELSC
jgi:hypothetical protein